MLWLIFTKVRKVQTILLFACGLLALLLAGIALSTHELSFAVDVAAAPNQQDSPLSAAQTSPLTLVTTMALTTAEIVTGATSAAVTTTDEAPISPLVTPSAEATVITGTVVTETVVTETVVTEAATEALTTTDLLTTVDLIPTPLITTTMTVTERAATSATITTVVTPTEVATEAPLQPSPLPTPVPSDEDPSLSFLSLDAWSAQFAAFVAGGPISLVLVGILLGTFIGAIGLVLVRRT